MFWENFWSNLAADSIIALFFSYLFIRWTNFFNRPRLSLTLEKKSFEKYSCLLMGIRNDGKSALREREINWHIYVPKSLLSDDFQIFALQQHYSA